MKFIKKYRKIIFVVAIIAFPFLLEWFLFVTPVVSKFSNETWFSFMASYAGVFATIIVFKLTIDKSNEDNKNAIKRLYLNQKIDDEINTIRNIMNVLLLNKYNFGDIINQGHFCSEYLKCHRDFWDIQGQLEDIAQEECFDSEPRRVLIEKLSKLEKMENLFFVAAIILGEYDNVTVSYQKMVKNIDTINKFSNEQREEIHNLFKEYNKEMIDRKFRY